MKDHTNTKSQHEKRIILKSARVCSVSFHAKITWQHWDNRHKVCRIRNTNKKQLPVLYAEYNYGHLANVKDAIFVRSPYWQRNAEKHSVLKTTNWWTSSQYGEHITGMILHYPMLHFQRLLRCADWIAAYMQRTLRRRVSLIKWILSPSSNWRYLLPASLRLPVAV